MHKFFAKPLFLGKKVVFLPQCHSTNDELGSMTKKENVPEGTIVYANHQLNGKGQRGNIWLDEPGKNVLMSVLLKPTKLTIQDQHYLNLISGLAVVDTIRLYTSGKCELKWPNDVYLNDRKICGILIENSLKKNTIEYSVVGIGFNLNQKGFNLSMATSLLMETNQTTKQDDFIDNLLAMLERWYLFLNGGHFEKILDAYHTILMWKDEWHEFESNGTKFKGVINGIDKSGRLNITNELGSMNSFGIKEVIFHV